MSKPAIATVRKLVTEHCGGLVVEVDQRTIDIGHHDAAGAHSFTIQRKARRVASKLAKLLGAASIHDNGSHSWIYWRSEPRGHSYELARANVD